MSEQVNQKLCGLEKMGVLLGLAASIFYAKAMLNREEEQHFDAQPRHVRHHFLELAISATKTRGCPAEQVDGVPDAKVAPLTRTATDEGRQPVRCNPTHSPAAVTRLPQGPAPLLAGSGDGVAQPVVDYFAGAVELTRAHSAHVLSFRGRVSAFGDPTALPGDARD